MVKAIFFDLYETLITELDPNWTPPPSAADLLGVDAALFEREWHARRERRMTGTYPDHASVLRDICHAIGHPPDEAIVRCLQEQRLAAKAPPFARVEEAMLKALQDIRHAGVKVGVISNCAPEEVAAWPRSPLPDCCDDAIFSCQVGCAKPAANIYLLACRRLQVDPREAVFVGDGGSDELAGATNIGMTAYWATWFIDRWPSWRRTGAVYKQASAYPRLRSLDELVALTETNASHSCNR